jgi:hypothetical protein
MASNTPVCSCSAQPGRWIQVIANLSQLVALPVHVSFLKNTAFRANLGLLHPARAIRGSQWVCQSRERCITLLPS